jgi:hypothetical protein
MTVGEFSSGAKRPNICSGIENPEEGHIPLLQREPLGEAFYHPLMFVQFALVRAERTTLPRANQPSVTLASLFQNVAGRNASRPLVSFP